MTIAKPENEIKAHLEHIETAFLQLSFAIKMWVYINSGKLERETFDVAIEVVDDSNYIFLKENEFENYDNLIIASEHNVSICFGIAAITLWEAIREKNAFEPRNLNPQTDKKQNLASLCYMIRCCFAHGSARPVWSIQNRKYKTTYRLQSKTIDLSEIDNGRPFDYSSIGGYETLWLLKDEAKKNHML